MYHEMFDEALKRYNEKQTRADWQMEDYYEKIRSRKTEDKTHVILQNIMNFRLSG